MRIAPMDSPCRNSVTPLGRPAPCGGRTVFLVLSMLLVPALLLGSGCTAAKLNTQALRAANAEQDLAFISRLPQAPPGPLTLQGAIAFALAHNVETQLADMQRAIQEEALTGRKLRMLPSLMAEYEVSHKSKSIPVRSEDPDTGADTLAPSISQDRTTQDLKVNLAWNILDFGVTYFKSRQTLNRITIMEEQIRRARQKLVLDVTRAYGQALVAQEAVALARGLAASHDERLRVLRASTEPSPDRRRAGLKSEIETLEGMNELNRHEAEYKAAKARLAQLLGLAPGAEVALARLEARRLPPPLEAGIRDLEREAVLNRAELSEKDIQEHISADEARIALARMFPSPALFLGYERNSNSFLTLHNWFSVGLNISWNLFSIPQHMSDRKRGELGQESVRMERMAVATAVLAQVHLAVLGYDEAVRQYLALEDVAARRADYAREMEEALARGQAGPDEALRERKAAFQARVASLRAYAEVLAEREGVFNTLGRDPNQDRGYALIQRPLPAQEQAALASARNVFLSPAGSVSQASVPRAGSPTATAGRAGSANSTAQAPASIQPTAPGPQGQTLAAAPAAPAPAQNGPAPREPGGFLVQTAPARAVPQAPAAPQDLPAPAPATPVQAFPAPAPRLVQASYTPGPAAPFRSSSLSGASGLPVQAPSSPAAAAPVSAGQIPAPSAAPRVSLGQEAGVLALRITAGPGLAEPSWFHLDGPDRLVIDIPGAAYDGPATLQVQDPLIRQIRVGAHPGKVRVVLDLRRAKGLVPVFRPTDWGMVVFLGKSGGYQAATGSGGPA